MPKFVKLNSIKLLAFGSVLSLVLFFSSIVFAQTPALNNFDVTVSPTFIDLSVKPGATVNQNIRLRNNTGNIIKVKPEIKIMGGDENGELTIKDTKEDYLSWLKIKNDEISLRPREWTTISFSIQVPNEAAYGYYWAISFTSTSQTVDRTGATVNASVAVPILLAVQKPGAKTEGKLLDFKTSKPVYEYPPITFTTTFENTGNIHIRPRGNVFIKDFLGRDVATLDINQTQGGILPNLRRSFDSVWNDGFITYEPKMRDGEQVLDKNGKPQTEMKIHFQKLLDLRVGKYTATALVLVSGQDRDYTYEKSISFFVFPWKVILVLIAIAVFVGIGLFTTLRTIWKRIRKIFRRK